MSNFLVNLFETNLSISAALLVLIIIYIIFEVWSVVFGYVDKFKVDCNQLVLLINRNNAQIIDIREEDLFAKKHIINSINIPESRFDDLSFLAKIKVSRNLVIVDSDGRKAKSYANKLRAAGYDLVQYLEGGLLEWANNLLPLNYSGSTESKSIINQNIVIYTKDDCPYCIGAKNLLSNKKLQYKEIKIMDNDTQEFKEMLAATNGLSTVPQIFIGDRHIAGFTELKKINDNGTLDKILKNYPSSSVL